MANEKSKIDELKKRLDARGAYSIPKRKAPEEYNYNRVEDIKPAWAAKEGEPELKREFIEEQMLKKKKSFLRLFLTGSILFFFLALAIAAFVILRGSNIISSDNVDIAVSGPVTVSGGEVLSLEIIIANNNNSDLELADLIIEFPEGTRSANNLSIELPRERFSLGNIGSGDQVNQRVEAILFGEEGDREKIKMTLEYRVAGSNAIFFKERELEIEISSSPVSFLVESLTDVNSGKEITLKVLISSNSKNVLQDLMFIAEYPFGFTFNSSVPRTSYDQGVWKIGDLSPGEERKIRIEGTLEGQDGEERVFRFFSGIQSKDDERELETAFTSSARSIFIKKPFLSLDVLINGSSSNNYTLSLGQVLNIDVDWQNNLPTSVANVEIEAKISGPINENSFLVQKGFYRSVDNTVIWSQDRTPVFESVRPGASGRSSFRATSLEFTGSGLSNPEIVVDVSVRGRRLSETGVSEEVISSVTKQIRLNSGLSLLPRVVHFSGPISNIGSIPPKADNETTYTVIWTLSNTVNDVSNAVVSATLPTYVGWKGIVSPGSEGVRYSSLNREITWDVGEISLGSGFGNPSREVAFQIGFLPSLSQVGTSPVLIGEVSVKGKDDFTGVVVSSKKSALDTQTSTDPSFKTGDGNVVE